MAFRLPRPTRAEVVAWLRRRGPWLALWLFLGLSFARPMWLPRILPLHDLPNHLGRITAWHYLDHPAWNLTPYYQRSLGLVPYLGHYLPVHLLAYVTGTVIRANLVYLVTYILVAPLCGLALARATGRSPLLAFLVLPICIGTMLQWGFISFCVGGVLMLLAAAVLYRLIDEPRLWRVGVLLVVTASLYLCHVLPWGAFGLYAAVLVLVELGARRWRSALYVIAGTVPTLLLFWGGLRHAARVGYVNTDSSTAIEWNLPGRFLARRTTYFNIISKTNLDDYILIGLVLLVLILIFSDGGPTGVPRRVAMRIPLFVLLLFVCGLATPFAVKRPFNWWMINQRFFFLLGLVGCFLPRGPLLGWRRVALLVGLAVSLILPMRLGRAYQDFSKRAMPIIDLINQAPLGATVLLVHTPSTPGSNRNFEDPLIGPGMTTWRELYNYPLVLRGGYSPYLYDNGFPVKALTELPHPKVESALVQVYSHDETEFNAAFLGQYWDYFVVRDDNLANLPPDGVVVVTSQGGWTLLRSLIHTNHPDPLPIKPAN